MCVCSHMHTCVHAGLHACTPLRMCKQRSTHKHTLACVRTWRGLIIMIVHHDDMQIMCVCSCICTVAHGYSQLYEGLKVHRPAHTCICAPARTFHGTNKLATTELQLYPAVISPAVFLQRLAVIPVNLQRLYSAVISFKKNSGTASYSYSSF